MEGFENRARINSEKRKNNIKRKREDEQETHRLLILQKTEEILTLLENTEDDFVLIKTRDYPTEVIGWLRRFYIVEPSYDDDDDRYHSLWRISVKAE